MYINAEVMANFTTKATRNLPLLNNITAPLNALGLNFIYFVIFEGRLYYLIHNDLRFSIKFIEQTESGSIFCKENFTTCLDQDYVFTYWPNSPLDVTMSLYFEHNKWNGITATKIDSRCNQIELYGFFTERANTHIQNLWFMYKPLLLKFIQHFDKHKPHLLIPSLSCKQELLELAKGFNSYIPPSKYEQESQQMQQALHQMQTVFCEPLTKRESEVHFLYSKGADPKTIGRRFGISYRTVEKHIENIKSKSYTHYKTELLEHPIIY